MTRAWPVGFLAVLATCAWGDAARADALKTYVFEGTINQVDNPTGVIDSSVHLGSPFALTVSIPADTPNDLAGNPTFGHYDFPGPGMSLTVNGQAVPVGDARNGTVSVITNPPSGDSFYGYQSFGSPGNAGLSEMRLDFDLKSLANKFTSDALPDTVNLADFPVNPSVFAHYFYGDNRAYPYFGGTIESVRVLAQPVPEPGTLAAFGLLALGLAATRVRGRDQADRRVSA